MTLGQKLKILLKDNGMTQEDLAERLEVSRQAAGKWVNDKGIPEVGKLIQISNLFGVSLDYLLKEDYEEKNSPEETVSSNRGYYVSREMLDGYLAYSRQRIRLIMGGISLFTVSNVFVSFENHSTIWSVLYWLTMTAGIILMLWWLFQTRQYREIREERLIFDDKVLEDFKKQRENRKKKSVIMMIAGVVILLASSEIGYAVMICCGKAACNVFEWTADTVWLALILWAGMRMHTDTVVMKNTEQTSRGGYGKRYRWIYMALPITALAVLIGLTTNGWSPYAPVLVLFCCLLVTTCKLLIEGRGKD